MNKQNAYNICPVRNNLSITSIQHNKETNINNALLTMFLFKF